MDEGYLNKLVNVAIHQLMRKDLSKTLELVRSNNVMGSPQGSCHILLNGSINLILSLIATARFL